MQAQLPALLDIGFGDRQALGDTAVELFEPALIGEVALRDEGFEAATVRLDLLEPDLVGIQVARLARQHEPARTGFDVLQGGQDGLGRGDDLQALADRLVGP